MNLTKLFNMQRVLDERIVKEKGLEGQDLLPQKILALQVELGECANEWRGFKFWSSDQEPRTFNGHKATANGIVEINPLLEEYIDCLHFILSIGLALGYQLEEIPTELFLHETTLLEMFGEMFWRISELDSQYANDDYVTLYTYEKLVSCFCWVGEMLGFSWEQIEAAYMEKNQTNHDRQSNGY